MVMSAVACLGGVLIAVSASAQDHKPKGLSPVDGPSGFKAGPLCPRGTHPVVETANTLQAYRCVPGEAAAPDSAARAPDAASDGRFSIPRQISFAYPKTFRIQNAWKEDVPTLYLQIDDAVAGRPVTITVTRWSKGQSDYQDLDAAIARDVDWGGAKDLGVQLIGRARARVTGIPGDTRSVYLPASKESYYSFVYSAPAASFASHLPEFSGLLKSLKLDGSAR
ncbi:MAG: hypothetical protein ACHQ49_17295 [Elusimicrobiota bacterium]